MAGLGARLGRVRHAVAELAASVEHSDAVGLRVDDDDLVARHDGDRAARLHVAPHSSAQLVAIHRAAVVCALC